MMLTNKDTSHGQTKSDSRWGARWDPMLLPEMVVTIAPNNQLVFLYEGSVQLWAKVAVDHDYVSLSFSRHIAIATTFYRRFVQFQFRIPDDMELLTLKIPLQHVTRLSWSDLGDVRALEQALA